MNLLKSKCEINQDECCGCGTCAEDCPEEAITLIGEEEYSISEDACNCCEGHFDTPACKAGCPIDAIICACSEDD